MIKPPLVVSITLLRLADHAGEFFDWVEVPHRLGPLGLSRHPLVF
jgi:hypothetical protein